MSLIPCALVLALLTLPAQAKPNFAGKWAGGRAMLNLAGVVGPQEMTISQDAAIQSRKDTYKRVQK